MIWALWLGCGLPAPADCGAMAAGPARDACWVEAAVASFPTDPDQAAESVAHIDDPVTRDLAWVRFTRDLDPGSLQWCRRIADPVIAAKCCVLAARPMRHDGRGKAGGPPR